MKKVATVYETIDGYLVVDERHAGEADSGQHFDTISDAVEDLEYMLLHYFHEGDDTEVSEEVE